MASAKACRWYAVLTQARAEPLATHHLRRQGYGVLYLHYPAEIRHARRIKAVTKPYFPRYVFAGAKDDQPVGPIAHSIGVAAIVQAAGEPLEVPREVIGELEARAGPDGLVAPPQALERPVWAPGQEVAIASGPFAGEQATVVVDDGSRIRLILRWLGRKVRATVAPDALVASSPALRSAPNA